MHGRGCKPAAQALRDIGVAALRAGIERDYPEELYLFDELDVRQAYYGDLSNALLEGCGRPYDPLIDAGDRHNALARLKSLDARKRFGLRQYDSVPGKSALPEFLANIVSPLCALFGLTRALLARLAPDFAAYISAESP